MSTQTPTYEETVAKIAALEKSNLELKTLFASKKGTDDKDEDDKKTEASFKQAMEEVDKDEKEKSASYSALKAAFKKAEDESDPEKKKEAMKKAMDMKEEHDKKAKKAEDEPKENIDKQKEKEAKIASVVMKKIPLMQKILEATKIMEPDNYAKVEKQLEAATLEEVQQRYDTIAPYLASVGIGSPSPTAQGQMGMIPFQANAVTNTTPDTLFEASVDQIDFSKVKTSDIMGMYK